MVTDEVADLAASKTLQDFEREQIFVYLETLLGASGRTSNQIR